MQFEHLRNVPAAIVAFVPSPAQYRRHLDKAGKALDTLHNMAQTKHLYVERIEPTESTREDSDLTAEERQKRQALLQAVSDGIFLKVDVAGSGSSSFIRELLRRAHEAEAFITVYADPPDPLMRWAKMMRIV